MSYNVGRVILYSSDEAPLNSTNPLYIQILGLNAINGDVVKITTTNTAQQLPNRTSERVITLIAQKNNVSTVYIGASNSVTNTSYMVALDQKDSYDFPITNLDLLWIYGNSGDGISYVAL